MDENDIVYKNMLCYDYFRCTYIIGGNYMKNTMSDSDTWLMCKHIAEHFYSERTISSPCIAA